MYRLFSVFLAVASVLAAGAGLSVWWVERSLSSNIETVELRPDGGPVVSGEGSTSVADASVADDPVVSYDNEVFLVLGSDTRVGAGNGRYGDSSYFGGARSDTAMLVYLPADRSWARVLSVPRDLVVSIPTDREVCGAQGYVEVTRFNEALTRGGVPCVVATLENLMPGLFVDHAVVVDFAGFESVVDALGGVDVCLNEPVRDSSSKSDIPAGVQKLNGRDFLALARARKSLADGSDISRIKRQQYLVGLVADQVSSSGLLTDPVRLFSVAEAVTSAVSTDPELASVGALVELAESVRGVSSRSIFTSTIPWVPDPSAPMSRVVPDAAEFEGAVAEFLSGERPKRPSVSSGNGTGSSSGSGSSSSGLFCKVGVTGSL